MKVCFTLLLLCFTSLCFGQNLNYQSVTYFNEDIEAKTKTEQHYTHCGLIKVLESDNKIFTPTGSYSINSKSIENGIVIYYCTGKDIYLNETPFVIEYDRNYRKVKIHQVSAETSNTYSVYFLVQ
ncbi:MAG: hypothetical protein NT150_07335 [Bacteroidetes bacterium]|nr:hypothetical protein [Bacteroidota bacterium]